MRRRLYPALIAVAWLIALPAAAEPQDVAWSDLKRPDVNLGHMNSLSSRQKRDFLRLYAIHDKELAGDEILSSDELKVAAYLRSKLEKLGVPVERLVRQTLSAQSARSAEAERLAASVSGKEIRILGYALPLSDDGGPVDLFLLVPYVGACIHVPAPPKDQILRVEMRDGFVPRARFDPVVITGRISVAPTVSELAFVDGTARIHSDYVLAASKLEWATFQQIADLATQADRQRSKRQKPTWPVSLPKAQSPN